MPSKDNLSPADRELVAQVAQLTGISDMTLVMSALEALRALDPNVINTLSNLNSQTMSDIDPDMVQALMDAIGGGAGDSIPGEPGMRRGGLGGRGRLPKRRMPMGRGGPPKRGRQS